MKAIETKIKKGYTLEVHYDESPSSPREDDNIFTFNCYHRNYDLSDVDQSDRDNIDQVKFPIYMYDHSSIALSSTPFGCKWDSGQVGIASISRAKIETEGLDVKKLEDYLEGELEEYQAYINGEVYGYMLTDEEDDVIESSWGYFTSEDAMTEGEYIMQQYIKKEEKFGVQMCLAL